MVACEQAPKEIGEQSFLFAPSSTGEPVHRLLLWCIYSCVWKNLVKKSQFQIQNHRTSGASSHKWYQHPYILTSRALNSCQTNLNFLKRRGLGRYGSTVQNSQRTSDQSTMKPRIRMVEQHFFTTQTLYKNEQQIIHQHQLIAISKFCTRS